MNDHLESATGELVLRIRGTNRSGELLRLRSPKCTIGSGQHCTLRLGAKYIEPVHCLILRSHEGTIVRRCAANTRLNGQSFSDAQLSPGDLLGIGPLEFEVVSLNDGAKARARNPQSEASMLSLASGRSSSNLESDLHKEESSKHEFRDELRKLDELKETLETQKAALDLRNFQINQDIAALEKERESFEREKDALETDRAAYQVEKDALLFEKNCFEVERQNWRIEQKELVSRQEAALDSQADAVKAAQAEIQSRHEELVAKQCELDARAAEYERHAAQFALECEKWEAEQCVREETLARREEESASHAQSQAARDEELRNEREQFDSLQSDLEWRILEVDRLRENLRLEQANFAKEQKDFRKEREILQQEQAAFLKEPESSSSERDDLQRERAKFVEEMAAFEKAREQFEHERIRFQADQEHFQQIQAKFERERALLQQEREEYELDRRRWKSLHTVAEQMETESASREVCDWNDAANAQHDGEKDSTQGTVDLREILRRLGHNVEVPENDAAEHQTASAESEHAIHTQQPAKSKSQEMASSVTSSDEDEESIDSYMAQLMQRLGVQSSSPGSARQQAVSNAAIEKKATDNPTSKVNASQVESKPENGRLRREPVVLSPRAVAPEKHVDISALRDLANLSAKHALGRHDLKQLVRATRSKLMVTLLSLSVGVGLLWHWSAHNTGKLTVFSAGLSFMIALYWGLQYAVLTGRLIVNRSGGITLRKHQGSPMSKAVQEKLSPKLGETQSQDHKQDAAPQANAQNTEQTSSDESSSV